MGNILFTPHIPPTDDLAGVLPTWRLGEAPIFWETLQAVPMPLAGLTYPEPVMPPATGRSSSARSSPRLSGAPHASAPRAPDWR